MEYRKGYFNVFIVTLWLVIMQGLLNSSDAQVTFSRDWNPGKRNMDGSDVHNVMKSANALCHLLMNQIKRLSACEAPNEDVELAAVPIFAGKL